MGAAENVEVLEQILAGEQREEQHQQRRATANPHAAARDEAMEIAIHESCCALRILHGESIHAASRRPSREGGVR